MIEDNSMHGGFIGVQFLGTDDSYILDNVISDNWRGITLESNMECLNDNTMPSCFYSTGNLVSGNTVSDNFLDLHHRDSLRRETPGQTTPARRRKAPRSRRASPPGP